MERYKSLQDAGKELHAFQQKTFTELEQLQRTWVGKDGVYCLIQTSVFRTV